MIVYHYISYMIRIQSVWYVFKVYDNVLLKESVLAYKLCMISIQSVWYVFKVYDNVL